MNRNIKPLVVIALLLSAACSGAAKKAPEPASAAHLPLNQATAAIANGRSIFLTGRDVNGVQISAQHKPLFQSCAACHMPNAAGGKHFSDGAVSADLRYSALVRGQNPPYTLALLERAISTGIDNMGKPLDPVMPRWKMSQRDLHDVAAYVLTQLK